MVPILDLECVNLILWKQGGFKQAMQSYQSCLDLCDYKAPQISNERRVLWISQEGLSILEFSLNI